MHLKDIVLKPVSYEAFNKNFMEWYVYPKKWRETHQYALIAKPYVAGSVREGVHDICGSALLDRISVHNGKNWEPYLKKWLTEEETEHIIDVTEKAACPKVEIEGRFQCGGLDIPYQRFYARFRKENNGLLMIKMVIGDRFNNWFSWQGTPQENHLIIAITPKMNYLGNLEDTILH